MTQPLENKNNEETNVTDQKLTDLERFIARRFDEISMEIEATSQLIDMAEEDAGKRFQDMLGMLHSVSFAGDGKSPANSGTELKAVVAETEKAATTIMDAADNIKNTLEKYDEALSEDMHLASLSEAIFTQAQNIIIACEFQDLISQRVTTALKNIEEVQERLGSTLEKFGVKMPTPEESAISNPTAPSGETSSASQDDIDALFD